MVRTNTLTRAAGGPTWSRKLGQIHTSSKPLQLRLHLRPTGSSLFSASRPFHSSYWVLAGPLLQQWLPPARPRLSFGAPDTAHDPFSTALGGEDPLHDSNGDSQTSDAVPDLFGSAAEAFPVDGAGSSSSATQPDAQQTWYDH